MNLNLNDFSAPYLTYDLIRKIASEFLNVYHPDGTIPIPIEEIAEFDLDITIIPMEKLQDKYEIENLQKNFF